MSVNRTMRRQRAREAKKAKEGRTTCPKCHNRHLVEKPGYGTVCPQCGWAKPEKEGDGDAE